VLLLGDTPDGPHQIGGLKLQYSAAKVAGKTMAILGYARVSTNGQDLAAQEAELMAAGAAPPSLRSEASLHTKAPASQLVAAFLLACPKNRASGPNRMEAA
jgi:hypothetical protein